VPPLSFFEYAALRQLPLPSLHGFGKDFLWAGVPDRHTLLQLVEDCRILEPHWPRYLLLGGFPELALLDDPGMLDLLRIDVVDRVLKRDMVALFNVRNILQLERLFVYLCLHTGEILNRETLAGELGVTAPTVDNYLTAMQMAHLVLLLPNVDIGGKKLLRTRPTAYLTHPSLRSAVLMQGEDALTDPAQLGHLVETAVVAATLGFAGEVASRAGYWRDPASGREVDLVLTLPRGAALVEVKYQPVAALRLGEGILLYRRDDPGVRRWLITRRPEDAGVDPETGLVRLPAFAYLYLLGWLTHREG
jgi:predicted AAA+ superfamily ATPase